MNYSKLYWMNEGKISAKKYDPRGRFHKILWFEFTASSVVEEICEGEICFTLRSFIKHKPITHGLYDTSKNLMLMLMLLKMMTSFLKNVFLMNVQK